MAKPDDTDELKTAIVTLWDGIAAEYDRTWAHGLHTPQEKHAWLALLRRLLPVDRPLRVLDVGCGTGFLSLLLAEIGHSVVGLDLSQAMLAVAQQRASSRSLQITLVLGDAESPPDSLGVFDAVVSRHLLWTLPHPERALHAWTSRLVPGGRVLAIDGFWKPTRAIDQAAASAGRLLRRLKARGPHTDNDYAPEVTNRLPLRNLTGLDPVRDLFNRAGLVDVATEALTAIDSVERSVMPVRHRLQFHHRRYLVQGRLRAGKSETPLKGRESACEEEPQSGGRDTG